MNSRKKGQGMLDHERNCYACTFHGLCYLRHKIRAAMTDACGMIDAEIHSGKTYTWQVIFTVIGNVCTMFKEFDKEEEREEGQDRLTKGEQNEFPR